MAQQTQPIKISISVQRKLSIATGLLSFIAFIIQGLGNTFGFEPVAEQIVQVCLLFSGGFSIYFGATTTQKITEENKRNEKN